MTGRKKGERGTKTRPAYLDDDRALITDLHARRNDPDAASKKAVRIESKPSGMQVISFRLPTGELRQVIRSARAAEESLSDFIRGALAIRLGREPFIGVIGWTAGAAGTESNFVINSPEWPIILGRSSYNFGYHDSHLTERTGTQTTFWGDDDSQKDQEKSGSSP